MALKGIILDIDGTLVDSNDAHTKAWQEALRKAGHDLSYEKIRRGIGMGSDNLLPALVGVEKQSPEGQRISQSWKEIFEREYLPGLKPFRGSRELVERMHSQGYKLAVASSAEKQMLEQLLDLVGIKPYLEEETSSADAQNSKPAPDIVQVALDRLGLEANEVVMLGDTPYDIESAGKLGIGTIALRCGGWGDKDLADALAIYDDPEAVLEQYAESPLARDHG